MDAPGVLAIVLGLAAVPAASAWWERESERTERRDLHRARATPGIATDGDPDSEVDDDGVSEAEPHNDERHSVPGVASRLDARGVQRVEPVCTECNTDGDPEARSGGRDGE